jgi:hypothetical protein
MSGLVRSLYTAASGNALVARVRTHPRVRAFARRRVSLLLAGSPTWTNVDGALRLLAEDSAQPIVFGAWPGDGTTELLYWAPFVRWAREHFELGERVFASAEAAPRGAVVFPAEPVAALFDAYRSGDGPLRPLLKRMTHVLLPAGDRAPIVTDYGAAAIEAALRGAPVIAVRPAGRALVEADVDLALRVVAGLNGTLVVLEQQELDALRGALASPAEDQEVR